jgi:hypothetical protein
MQAGSLPLINVDIQVVGLGGTSLPQDVWLVETPHLGRKIFGFRGTRGLQAQ